MERDDRELFDNDEDFDLNELFSADFIKANQTPEATIERVRMLMRSLFYEDLSPELKARLMEWLVSDYHSEEKEIAMREIFDGIVLGDDSAESSLELLKNRLLTDKNPDESPDDI